MNELCLQDLPEHIILLVMKQLDVRDLLAFGSTCLQYNRLCYYPTLWKNFLLTIDKHSRSIRYPSDLRYSLISLANKIPDCISSVVWKMSNEFHSALYEIVVRNPWIHTLYITDNCMTSKQFNEIGFLLPHLRFLSLGACESLTDEIFTSLSSLTNLSYIDISYCNLISDEGFGKFASNCSELVSVNTDNVNWLADHSINILISKHYQTLLHLNIDGEKNTDSVFPVIETCTRLQSLTVNFAEQLTDFALECVSKLKYLEEICFRKAGNFTSYGLENFLSNSHLYCLKKLNLTECGNFSDTCAGKISKNCKNLTHLSLAWCWETTESGIPGIVESCHLLEELDLTGLHQITGSCFEAIPIFLPKLRSLKLEMCNNVQDDIIEDCVFFMQGSLQIYNYYSELLQYQPHNHDDV